MDSGSPPVGAGVRPVWLPHGDGLSPVTVGEWWDAIAVDGPLGTATAAHLQDHADPCGPVAVAPHPVPRYYVLVPAGTAAWWQEPRTLPFGRGDFLGLPGSLTSSAHAVRWHIPPQMQEDPPLTAAEQLRAALAAARRATL